MIAKIKLLVIGVLLALFACAFYAGYLKGWYAHSEHVNSLAKTKQKKAENAVAVGEKKAAAASTEAKVIYRTVYRDVVTYVNDPNHIKCDFDDHAVQLRQRALDAANSISGFDAGAVQGSE